MEYTLYYRNFLKYCNYSCSYCPFSKYSLNNEELEKDIKYFEKFIKYIKNNTDTFRIFIAPKGEILNFDHYKNGISELSKMNNLKEIVIQTNLSGDLTWLNSVDKDKVILWTTYHPDETGLEDFYSQIKTLYDMNIRFSVGSVGIKENFPALSKLKMKLEDFGTHEPYFWVNAYKDKKDYYSSEEIEFLVSIDPLFELNLENYLSKGLKCKTGNNIFWVEYNGLVHRCWQDKKVLGNLFCDELKSFSNHSVCRYSKCTCYIGYIHILQLQMEKFYSQSLLGRIP